MSPTTETPQEEEEVVLPEKGAAMYWGENLMSTSSGMMSSMFGVSPESPKKDDSPATPQQSRGMMLASGAAATASAGPPLGTVQENQPKGVLESMATILGSSIGGGRGGVVVTQLPEDRVTTGVGGKGGAFATQVPADRQRGGGGGTSWREPDPMATVRGGEPPPTNSGSTLFGSRLAIFSMVGRQDDGPPLGEDGPSFGPPPMIQLVKEQTAQPRFTWLCCGAPGDSVVT